MYELSDAYLNQIKKKHVQTFALKGKLNTIEFTDHDIVSGSLNITNQCSEENDIKIGSVYIAEMKCTFKQGISVNKWKKAVISISEGLYIEETDTYDYIPLGIFYVAEADNTDYGTDVVAYDAMSKFNVKCSLSTTKGKPYDLALLACEKCKVELGMTEEEMGVLPNGTETLSLYTENDIETWQDFIFWLAQATGTFATINRYGKLVFLRYGNNVVESLSNHERFMGSKFSQFETRYSGLSVVNIKDKKTNYYSVDPDDYLTYNLGPNPFLQYGVKKQKDKIRKNVLTALLNINYVPFETGVITTSFYDLGDVICCTDGIAGGKNSCIMYYDYTYNNGCNIAGYGSNPDLASAHSKADKNLSGLRESVNNSEVLFFTFENAKDISIGDGETKSIIDIRFTSSVSIGVLFQAQVLIEAETTDNVIGVISYDLNEEEIIEYKPTETWINGKHILSLMYMLMIDENSINRWIVKLNVSGGVINIKQGGIHAVVYGQGLVATVDWDGYITAQDKLNVLNLIGNIVVDAVTDDVAACMIDVNRVSAEDTLQDIILQDCTKVDTIVESCEIRWSIKYWMFNTEQEATYASRYVDTSNGVYKLAQSFENKSENIVIDTGLMNAVSIDNTEFESINAITISHDETEVKYLICSEDRWYTVSDNMLTELSLSGDTISAVDFVSGIDTEPASAILTTLTSPVIYKWTSADRIQEMSATITATPHAQTIQAICDMSDVSIYGIAGAEADYTGNINVRLSYNSGLVFTDEESITSALKESLLQAYDNLNENKILTIAFILSSTEDTLTEFKYSFNNEE